MVVGGLSVTDAGRAGHFLLWAIKWSMTWNAWVGGRFG